GPVRDGNDADYETAAATSCRRSGCHGRRDPAGIRGTEKISEGAFAARGKAVPLRTTALVHEAFLKLVGSRHLSYENRVHFYGIATRLMRQVLVDTARARNAEKRDAAEEVALDDVFDWGPQPNRPVLALDDALQQLEKADALQAQLIEMRYFGGMTA